MTGATPNGAPTARELLKVNSSDLHAVADAWLSRLLADKDEGYGRFLQVMTAAIVPLERAVAGAGVCDVLPDWERRARSAALLADLAELDLVAPPMGPPPDVSGEAKLFGVLYVLEGSRLGAQVILRRLRINANFDDRCAHRYLSHGSGQQLWTEFLSHLAASRAVRETPNDAIDGARTAFALFCDRSAAQPVTPQPALVDKGPHGQLQY